MKKILASIILVINLFVFSQCATATDFTKISHNPKITQALDSLETINRRDVIAILLGRNNTRKPIRVMFRDLNIYGYKDCEAVTIRTRDGGLVIYISQEHRSASIECIACLIANESQHHTFTNSRMEELRAWVSETQAWNEFVKRNKALATATEPLAKRENYIARIRSKNGIQGIQKIIAVNPVYSNLD